MDMRDICAFSAQDIAAPIVNEKLVLCSMLYIYEILHF